MKFTHDTTPRDTLAYLPDLARNHPLPSPPLPAPTRYETIFFQAYHSLSPPPYIIPVPPPPPELASERCSPEWSASSAGTPCLRLLQTQIQVAGAPESLHRACINTGGTFTRFLCRDIPHKHINTVFWPDPTHLDSQSTAVPKAFFSPPPACTVCKNIRNPTDH